MVNALHPEVATIKLLRPDHTGHGAPLLRELEKLEANNKPVAPSQRRLTQPKHLSEQLNEEVSNLRPWPCMLLVPSVLRVLLTSA